MPQAAELDARVAFHRRATIDDGYGNVEGGFDPNPAFPAVAAQIRPKLGGEEVFAARLGGRNPVNIIVRKSNNTEQVTTDWAAKNTRSGEVYNIRSVIDPDGENRWLEMLCEQGAPI